MKVNGPKNINMLLHLLIWFDTRHGQKCYTKKERKENRNLTRTHKPNLRFPFFKLLFSKYKNRQPENSG